MNNIVIFVVGLAVFALALASTFIAFIASDYPNESATSGLQESRETKTTTFSDSNR